MRQLTGLDAQFLAFETPRQSGHFSVLTILDPSTRPEGRLELSDVRSMIAERLPLLAPFRWRLREVPLGLDYPYWIDDPEFDLDYHVRELALPPPLTDAKLANQVARIVERPLDHARPLWEMYLIDGLRDGNVGMLTKVHHAAVDGMSGAEIGEAQNLTRDCFEHLRHLHDDPATRFALLFDGGDGCWEVLAREPMLRSRIYRRVAFAPLSDRDVLELIPTYHPIYHDADPELLLLIDDSATNGRLRFWAAFTHTAAAICHSRHANHIDRSIVESAITQLAGAR
ncbi:MAG: wax ester/triacylglycerol synthase domain-containing protein [Solirubrobacteraceae bacterium]